jgi:uncharacterized RDD family membrane protein YckC
MTEENPYAPPSTEPPLERAVVRDAPLARRLTRLAASFIDGLITFALAVPFLAMVYANGDTAARDISRPALTAAVAVPAWGLFLLLNFQFLRANGQTLGKKITGIRIAELDGGVPPLSRLILMRFLPVWLVGLIPGIGRFLTLIDVLFIFGAERRCIHDRIAGTKVVMIA